MNKNFKLSYFSILFLLCFSSTLFGQEKPVSETEFFSVVGDATDTAIATNRKTTETSVYYSDGKVIKEEKEIAEYIVPGKHKSLIITKKDGKETRIEKISIGDTKYIRENDGNWKRAENSGGVILLGRGVEPKLTSTFSISEIKEISDKFYILNIVKEDSDKKSFISERYLIDKDGVLKQIITVISNSNKDNFFKKSIKTYEYSPEGLKIEAPTLIEENL